MKEHRWFKTKTTTLKELWKKRLISFEQLYSMYQQAQEFDFWYEVLEYIEGWN